MFSGGQGPPGSSTDIDDKGPDASVTYKPITTGKHKLLECQNGASVEATSCQKIQSKKKKKFEPYWTLVVMLSS